MNHLRKKDAVRRYSEPATTLTEEELRDTLVMDDKKYTPEEIDEIVAELLSGDQGGEGDQGTEADQGLDAESGQNAPSVTSLEPTAGIDSRLIAPATPTVEEAPKAERPKYPVYDLWKVDVAIKDDQVTLELVSKIKTGVKISHATADSLNTQAHNSSRYNLLAGVGRNGELVKYKLK